MPSLTRPADPTAAASNRLRTRDGRELRFDLYVDASGFRSRLMGDSLRSPFISYAASLFCDTAVVADVPQGSGIEPFTLAETMDCGWCWKIPVEGVDHRGYVHASAFLSETQAIEEMRAKNPGMGDTRTVRFRSGRHTDFWKGNVVAIGNAYGFVEPLESTALHMVIVELAYLIAGLEAGADDPAGLADLNRRVGAHWDYLRWFLALHYKFNRKLDTAFWRACRDDVDVSGLAPAIAHFQERGPWTSAAGLGCLADDPVFGDQGVMILLLGQKVDAPMPTPPTSRADWTMRMAAQSALIQRAATHAEALDLMRERPALLHEFVSSPSSWCNTNAEVIHVSAASGRARMPHHR